MHKVRDNIPCTHRVSIVCDPKKNNVRLAPDMRILNQYTFPYAFHNQVREDLIPGVSAASVLIQFDLTHAYYSMEVDKADQAYQCISIDGEAYRIKRLVQGSNMGRSVFECAAHAFVERVEKDCIAKGLDEVRIV